jgi:hypothetical protein
MGDATGKRNEGIELLLRERFLMNSFEVYSGPQNLDQTIS